MQRFNLVAELEPEQKTVLTLCTMPRSQNEFIIVQGVAGSGKTTIALHTLRSLGEIAASQAADDRMSLLLLTYNKRLAESCANTLRDQPALERAQLVSETGTLSMGKLNVLSFRDLCGLVLTDQDRRLILDDKICIGEVGRIARNRGVRDLLPSQVFALITTFLRGRPELLDLSYEELDARITAEMARSAGYRMYGDSLRTVRRYVLQSYDNWKRDSLDRSDIAARLRSSLVRSETHLRRLKELTAKEIRTASQRRLGDQDVQIGEGMDWLRKAMAGFQSCSAIEAQVREYSRLLEGRSIDQDMLDQLREDLLRWIRAYGLRGSPKWEAIGERLSNPIIIVDELQDLSAIENEALISLWFQLERQENSRLVLFGDLNQQMNPAGFEWDHILKLLRERAELYGYDHAEAYFSQGFTDDHWDLRCPFRLLDNNYRTTPQIAHLAHQLVEQVARYSFEPETASRYLKHTIDPERTMPYNLAAKLATMSETEKSPRILVGDAQLFVDALSKHVAETAVLSDASGPEREMLATVIITEHPDTIEAFVQSEETGAALSLVSYIPTLSCKGLEFDSCVLFGISTKKTGQLEADMLARWYTSVTRAKLKLLVYLSPEEFAYIQHAGWTDIPANVAVVQWVSDVGSVLRALKWVGTTELGEEEYKILGEINLASFHRYHDERYIRESLRHFERGGWLSERADAAAEAAEYFESQRQYLKAADYYEEGERTVGLVRCIEARCKQSLEAGNATEEITKLRERAHQAISRLPSDSHLDRAFCYLELQEWEKALQSARHTDVNGQALVGDRVLEAMRQQLRLGMLTWPTELPGILEKHGFFGHAGRGWAELGRWDHALGCADKATQAERNQLLKMALTHAAEKELHLEVRGSIAEQLEVHHHWRQAAEAWGSLGKHHAAIRCLVKIPDLKAAQEYLTRVSAEDREDCLKILAEAHYQQGHLTWPEAYAYYLAADMRSEADNILRRCRDNREYVLLTRCCKRAGDIDGARAVANEREIQDENSDAETAAKCWEVIEDWEDSARSWMRTYYRDLETCEMLLGPNPDDKAVHRAILNRCFDHLGRQREAYGISEEHWRDSMVFAAHSEQQARQAIVNMIQIASKSQAWRRDLQKFHNHLQEAIQRSEIVPPSRMKTLNVPFEDRSLTPAEIRQLWAACENRFVLFNERAEDIARELCVSGKDRLLALRILHNVCKNKSEAARLAEELRKSSDGGSRRLWIRSWRILELSEGEVRAWLQDLDPVRDKDLILFAIDDYYSDDAQGRESARARYRGRLSHLGTSEAKQLLAEIFGEEPEKPAPKPKPAKSSLPRNLKLNDLLEELVLRVEALSIDHEDLAEFQRRIEHIVQNPDDKERLPRRWKRAKELLPDMVPEDHQALISRIDQTIWRLLAEGQVAQKAELEIAAPVVSEEPGPDREAPKAELGGNTAEAATTPAAAPTEEGRRPRRQPTETSRPGRYEELDLHDMSKKDALIRLEAQMRAVTKDPSIRCLVVVHGYGKTQGKPVIRGEVRSYLDRQRKSYGRVRRILPGERLGGLDEDSQAVREVCPEISFDKLGRNNPGITVVLLD